jgi:hypothetical protein
MFRWRSAILAATSRGLTKRYPAPPATPSATPSSPTTSDREAASSSARPPPSATRGLLSLARPRELRRQPSVCLAQTSLGPVRSTNAVSAPFTPVEGEDTLVAAANTGPAAYVCKSCELPVFSLPGDFAAGEALGVHPRGWPVCVQSGPQAVSILPRRMLDAAADVGPVSPVALPLRTPTAPMSAATAAWRPTRAVVTGAANMPVRKSMLLCGATYTSAVASPQSLMKELDAGQFRAERKERRKIHRRRYIQQAPRCDPVVMEGRCRRCRTLVCRVHPRKGQGVVFVVEPAGVRCTMPCS